MSLNGHSQNLAGVSDGVSVFPSKSTDWVETAEWAGSWHMRGLGE